MHKYARKFSYKEPKPKKTVGVCRFGAFGDLIQASSIFPGLKAQGYHITLHTTPTGAEIVKHDPHIDKIELQDNNQVPNEQLTPYWDHLRKRYDKFINLSESVEGTLLAIPGRVNHSWTPEVRHKYMNVNYLEFTHDLAGVPFKAAQKFYPTEEEKSWARKEKGKHGKIILWSLSGSAIHKAWPHLDTILARIMVATDYKVVLVGDQMCQLLEQGWENEPRILKRSGVWTIRQSLSFAQVADLVIGPETGVLNAVGLEDVPKIITLSHSSEENLTKHWKNVTALKQPVSDLPCSKFACHMMHYNFDHCYRDEETGQAKCQVNITADQMWDAITKVIEERRAA